jgi:uncharacterized protein DUF6496
MPRMSPKGQATQRKVHKVLAEYKAGTLHSGSDTGPIITDRKQAVAVALNSARRAGAKRRRKH